MENINLLKKVSLRALVSVLILISFVVGYAAGRGYKTYEIRLQEDTKKYESSKTPQVSLETLLKKHTQIFSGWRDPKVEAISTPDSLGGNTLSLKFSSFFLTPDEFGNTPKANTGSAYILVNDILVGRAFTNFFSIPSYALRTGTNTVQVVLAANDGSVWIAKGTGKQISTTLEILK